MRDTKYVAYLLRQIADGRRLLARFGNRLTPLQNELLEVYWQATEKALAPDKPLNARQNAQSEVHKRFAHKLNMTPAKVSNIRNVALELLEEFERNPDAPTAQDRLMAQREEANERIKEHWRWHEDQKALLEDRMKKRLAKDSEAIRLIDIESHGSLE